MYKRRRLTRNRVLRSPASDQPKRQRHVPMFSHACETRGLLKHSAARHACAYAQFRSHFSDVIVAQVLESFREISSARKADVNLVSLEALPSKIGDTVYSTAPLQASHVRLRAGDWPSKTGDERGSFLHPLSPAAARTADRRTASAPLATNGLTSAHAG